MPLTHESPSYNKYIFLFFPTERLGDRLERDGGLDSQRNSEICFVAAGQLSHLIRNRIAADISTEALQVCTEY